MRYQDYIVEATRAAADEAFRFARAVPADKLDWKPLEAGRSVLDQCKEMALCARWAKQIIESETAPEFNEETMAMVERQKAALGTLDECEAECRRSLDELFALYRTIPDDRLQNKKWLPFDGGREFTVMEQMDYPRWNYTYHLGQIAYIQTLYGDRQMH